MNFLKDIIQRCHRRQKNSLQQQKTVATPSILRRSYTHQYRVYCARNYPVLLDDLEQAGISFMPIGHAPKHDSGAQGLAVGSRRFTRRFGIEDWKPQRWEQSWGIQIYTGIPSERDGARWHDIEFKYEAICAAPDAVLACIEVIVNAVANPLLTLTKVRWTYDSLAGYRTICTPTPKKNDCISYTGTHRPLKIHATETCTSRYLWRQRIQPLGCPL